MNKLKDCPFCGSEAYWCGEGPGDEAHECHQIRCSGCSFQVDLDSYEAKSEETMEGLKDVVSAAWNKRA